MGLSLFTIQKKSSQMTSYKFKIGGKPYEVSIDGISDGIADVTVNGVSYSVEIEQAPGQPGAVPAADGKSVPAKADLPQNMGPAGGESLPSQGAAGKKTVSPLPGVIIDVCVSEGQAVKRGQKIAVLEAMKMENEILSETDGTVTKLFVKKGDSVLEGADIASIA